MEGIVDFYDFYVFCARAITYTGSGTCYKLLWHVIPTRGPTHGRF